MRDFSVDIYHRLLDNLQEAGFRFQTIQEYLNEPLTGVILLRHDVDDRKLHSLEFAKIQHQRGIVGTYYFRIVPQSFDEGVIREIWEMGHEVGYHYEDMDLAKGDPDQAIRLFEKNLETLKKIVPVSTICMHGSPLSRYDNRDLWKHYDYRDFGITGEPYFDIDFSKVFYLTDTGRRWDGQKVSVRDKVEDHFGLSFHSTHDIIDSLHREDFPRTVLFNFHPQRWTNDHFLWVKEKILQRGKNVAKYYVASLLKS